MTSGDSGGDSAAPGLEAGGEPLIGRVIDDRYRIDAVLGTGGVGVVYRGEHMALARPVAIKVLHEYFGDREDLRRRFEREAKVLSTLAHPHIVAITDHGMIEGMPYLAMELLEGQTLGDLLRGGKQLDPDTALHIARGILRGLAFAHARGVLHRDLKPANVFLQKLPDDPYHVKLLDFGLAKIVEAEDEEVDELTLTRSGTVLGTPAYMSPEQASGATVDAQTDVYSAGCVIFELFAGQPPFMADTRPELIRKHMLSPVPTLGEACPGLEPVPELQAVLERSLRKDPRERFADAEKMMEAVDVLPRPVVRGVPSGGRPGRESGTHRRLSSSTESPTVAGKSGSASAHHEPPPERERPFRWVGWAVAVLGVALAATGGVLAWQSATPRGEAGDYDGPRTEVSLTGEETALEDESPSDEAGESGSAEPAADREAEAAEAKAPGAADSEPSPDEGSDAAEGTDESESSEGSAKPEARYLLAAGVPRTLRPYWLRVRRDRKLARAHHRRLRRLQQRFEEDPRPSLLLGHDFSQRGWFSDALERYEVAHEIDPSSRGDPRMLRNMVRMSTTRALHRKASSLIETIYGREALDQVDAALERRQDPDQIERLKALRRRLAR